MAGNAARMSVVMEKELATLDSSIVTSFRGRGLFWGVVIRNDKGNLVTLGVVPCVFMCQCVCNGSNSHRRCDPKALSLSLVAREVMTHNPMGYCNMPNSTHIVMVPTLLKGSPHIVHYNWAQKYFSMELCA